MPQHIDYVGKSDHDLLVELVAQGNSTVERLKSIDNHLEEQNGKVTKSCTAIAKLETVNKAFYGVLAVIGGARIKIFVD
jgi:3'-phosphoadenosine 5'-phosphosulfate sulfotransferase (PAPS reductase)/FAD synthetase